MRRRLVAILALALLLAAPQLVLDEDAAVLPYHLVMWPCLGVALLVIWRRRMPLGWLLVALGWVGWALGDVWFDVAFLRGEVPFPSAADWFYIAGYGLLAAGLLLLVRARQPKGDLRGGIDAAIVTVAALLLAWVYILVPITAEPMPMLHLAVSFAYPLGDLTCLAMAARLATGRLHGDGERMPLALALLLASMAATLVADAGFLVLTAQTGDGTAGWLSALYVVAYVLGMGAVVDPSAAELVRPVPVTDPAVSPGRLAALAGLTMIGPLVLLVQWTRGDVSAVPAVVLCTAAMFALVLARMADLVAALRRSQVRLRHEATHDHLTGLANRSLFTDVLRASTATGDGCAVLMIDLDEFKALNDTLGHAAGDAALVEVARRLEAAVRAGDVVARLAGDEFAVVLPGTHAGALESIVARVHEAVNGDIDLDGHPWHVTGSIGVASVDRSGVDDMERLVRSADAAMYGAKRCRRRTAA
jgi:diguanylate cyclase (GGDEF)-like protein